MSRSGEFDWISRYLAPLAAPDAFSLKDDAALLPKLGEERICITQDAILEGVHFLANDPIDQIAQKAIRVNVSDCVAKGSTPFAYSCALGVPDRWGDDDIKRFAEGLRSDQATYGLALTGGDTYRSPERLCIAITMLARVENEQAYVSRIGAQIGDIVCVTGTIGDAALGLKVAQGRLKTKHDQHFVAAYRLPQPPFGIQDLLSGATAAMDISDGLMGDARKLAEASNVQIVLQREAVPLSKPVSALIGQSDDHWADVLGGGDDYQTLFTCPENRVSEISDAANGLGIRVTKIGEVAEKADKSVSLTAKGVAVSLDKESFSHF